MKPNLLLFILEKFRDPKPKFQSLTLYIYIHTYEFKLQNKTTSGAAVDPHLNAPIRIWNSIELPWVHRKKTLAKQGLVWYILQKNHKICNRPGGDLHPCFLNIRSNQIAIRGIDLSFGAGIPEQLTHPGCCYNARLPPSAPSASPSAYWPCLSLITMSLVVLTHPCETYFLIKFDHVSQISVGQTAHVFIETNT